MRDFLRLSSWSGGLSYFSWGNTPEKNFWPVFVAHCESCAQNIKTVVLEIRASRFLRERKLFYHILYFFLENSEIPVTLWT